MVGEKCTCQESLDEDCKDENKDSTQKEQDEDDDLDDFDVDYHHLIHATAKELATKFKLIVSNAVEGKQINKQSEKVVST